MGTLYDLLGALPRDDADELRAAFRSAVKGVHPDLNPGDPNAAQKFREIVRANEILGDEEQRAAYDHLLDLAHKEQKQQATAKTMHKAATSVIALVIAASASFGGYLVHQHLPLVSDRLKHLAEIATASPADFAGLTPAQAKAQPAAAAPEARIKAADANTEAATSDVKTVADAMAQAAPAETNVQIASVEPPPAESAEKAETTGSVPSEAIVPASTAPKAQSESAPQAPVGPPLEIAPGDAKVFRERGIFAYRSGDFYGAVANLTAPSRSIRNSRAPMSIAASCSIACSSSNGPSPTSPMPSGSKRTSAPRRTGKRSPRRRPPRSASRRSSSTAARSWSDWTAADFTSVFYPVAAAGRESFIKAGS